VALPWLRAFTLDVWVDVSMLRLDKRATPLFPCLESLTLGGLLGPTRDYDRSVDAFLCGPPSFACLPPRSIKMLAAALVKNIYIYTYQYGIAYRWEQARANIALRE
jgi:hypothetical protein